MIVADRDEALVVEPVAGVVSWAWILAVHDASTTRLISRVRVRLGHKPLLVACAPAVDLPWFLMERQDALRHQAPRGIAGARSEVLDSTLRRPRRPFTTPNGTAARRETATVR